MLSTSKKIVTEFLMITINLLIFNFFNVIIILNKFWAGGKIIIMSKEIAKNPTAKHNYTILNTLEAGIVLTGTEIKSIRKGKVNMKNCYAIIKNGECFVLGMHISPYEQGNIFNKDPLRSRKLLLTKREIYKLTGLIKQQGVSLVPISMYFKNNYVKIELGVGKGKKLYDKRQEEAKKDANLYIRRHMLEKNNY